VDLDYFAVFTGAGCCCQLGFLPNGAMLTNQYPGLHCVFSISLDVIISSYKKKNRKKAKNSPIKTASAQSATSFRSGIGS